MVKEIFKFSIRRLIQTKINGGIVLLFVALAAMLIANSPLQEYYNILLSKNIPLTIGNFNLFDRHDGNPLTLLDFRDQTGTTCWATLLSPESLTSGCGSLRGHDHPGPVFLADQSIRPCHAGSCHTHGNGHRFFPRRSLTPRQESPLESENIPHRLCRRG